MKVFFEKRVELATGIWQYYFQPERPVDFVPGQYVDFHIAAVRNDPRGPMRTFTLTSQPSDELLSFVVKFVPPLSPYKQALQYLKHGDELRIDDAMGDLVLPKNPAVPLVFIAGGIGIASFVSMLKWLIAHKEERSIFFFYGLRKRNEQLFREIMRGYPLELQTIAIAPNRLSAEDIRASTPPDALFYVSGSQGFVEGLRTDLQTLGVQHEQIVFDYFDGYIEL